MTTKLNCIIIDDEPLSREMLRNCVSKTASLKLMGSYSNALEGRVALDKKDIDLIFLDVEMPEMTGLEFLESFRDVPQVIIVTSEKKYAFESYKYDVTDFLSKPIDMQRFQQAVDRACFYEENLRRKQDEDHFYIKCDQGIVKLRTAEVDYVEAMGDYVKVVTPESNYIVHSTMKAFVAKLPGNTFFRLHKSYIVNLQKIEELSEGFAIGEYFNLPVSRSHKRELQELILQRTGKASYGDGLNS